MVEPAPCTEENCKRYGYYGFPENNEVLFCHDCYNNLAKMNKKGMKNLRSGKCEECEKSASFNFPGKKRRLRCK